MISHEWLLNHYEAGPYCRCELYVSFSMDDDLKKNDMKCKKQAQEIVFKLSFIVIFIWKPSSVKYANFYNSYHYCGFDKENLLCPLVFFR